MQRLTDLFRGRLSGERGATAVLFALLLVPLLGFAAIAVDIGALYAERARLQVAADAAAIAVAQDCSRGTCGDMLATARAMVAANDGDASAAQPVLEQRPAECHRHRPHARPALVRARHRPRLHRGLGDAPPSAGVRPSGGTAVLPLTFSWCAFTAQTGGGLPSGTVVRRRSTSRRRRTRRLHRPVENVVPGGFAYLSTDPGKCAATTAPRRPVDVRTGNSVPSACSTADFSTWVGQTVLLPLFDESGDTGSNAWYRVYGYAAFTADRLLARRLSTTPARSRARGTSAASAATSPGSSTCATPGPTAPTAPQLGASILRLIR